MKRLLLMVLMVGLCGAGCRSARVEEVKPAPPPAQATPPAAGVEVVTLTLRVAPELLSPRGAGRRGRRSCPQTRLHELLGIRFARPHGCLVGGVEPGSLAEQAGLRAGDRIIECNGQKVTCPASLLPRLSLGREPGLVELTIERSAGGKDS